MVSYEICKIVILINNAFVDINSAKAFFMQIRVIPFKSIELNINKFKWTIDCSNSLAYGQEKKDMLKISEENWIFFTVLLLKMLLLYFTL